MMAFVAAVVDDGLVTAVVDDGLAAGFEKATPQRMTSHTMWRARSFTRSC